MKIDSIVHLKWVFEVQHLNKHVLKWMALNFGVMLRVTATVKKKNLKDSSKWTWYIVGDESDLDFDCWTQKKIKSTNFCFLGEASVSVRHTGTWSTFTPLFTIALIFSTLKTKIRMFKHYMFHCLLLSARTMFKHYRKINFENKTYFFDFSFQSLVMQLCDNCRVISPTLSPYVSRQGLVAQHADRAYLSAKMLNLELR